MLGWLNGRNDVTKRATALHEAIVAEARSPHLYATLRVPDTLDGRLEMLTLHMVIVLDRLGRAGPAGGELARALTEAYVIAMDDTMRAIGVGDLAVPRKVKKAAAALYDRNRSYGPALAAANDEADSATALWHDTLVDILKPLAGAVDTDLSSLAHYGQTRVVSLAGLPNEALLAGQLVA
jgi:cytochrome b pre-mRNA-processing protein 3